MIIFRLQRVKCWGHTSRHLEVELLWQPVQTHLKCSSHYKKANKTHKMGADVDLYSRGVGKRRIVDVMIDYVHLSTHVLALVQTDATHATTRLPIGA